MVKWIGFPSSLRDADVFLQKKKRENDVVAMQSVLNEAILN